MRHSFARCVAGCLASTSAFSAFGAVTPPDPGSPVLPSGARVVADGDRVVSVYGVPMGSAKTPEEAAANWWSSHGVVFGVGRPTLALSWASPIAGGRFIVLAYTQTIDGLPVEHGLARVVVMNGAPARVVMVSARLAKPPAGDVGPPALGAAEAAQRARTQAHDLALTHWSEPELVVFAGESRRIDAVRAWKVTGEIPDRVARARLTFFIDAATGAILETRDEILHEDVAGTVEAKVTPGVLPDIPGNPPAWVRVPAIRASIDGGAAAYTDHLGAFLIPHAGSAPVTVRTQVGPEDFWGRWVYVLNEAGAEIKDTRQINPPGPATLKLNTSPTEAKTAQANAFVHVSRVHDYFRDRAPGLTVLDVPIEATVNVALACNAYYDGSSINFFASGGGCRNAAYSTIIAHEYAHHVAASLGLAQGAFGEGFCDSTALLLHDTGVFGAAFYDTGLPLRDIDAAMRQYPCTGASHDCGQVLAGVWRDLRLRLGSSMGSAPGLALTRQLHVDWIQVTIGGNLADSAWPMTAVEVLVVDDDDGNINNGTPHYEDIAFAFGQHGIACPPIQALAFEYPQGRPDIIEPGASTPVHVHVVAAASQPGLAPVTISTSVDGAPFTTANFSGGIGGAALQGALPPAPCGSSVRYYITATALGGAVVTDPPGAPGETYSALVASQLTPVFADDFETDLLWSKFALDDDAVRGRWSRGVPGFTTAQPGVDRTPTGTRCWVTDYRPGLNAEEFDVDQGKTTLTSPRLTLGGADDARISYWRWFSNNQGTGAYTDALAVDVSNDDGQTWTRVETIGPTGMQVGGGWFHHRFVLGEHLPPTDFVRVRFVASDLGIPTIVEAAVDDFVVEAVACAAACAPDLNGDDHLDVLDVILFQTLFALQDPRADFDHNGAFNVSDVVAFQTAFAIGCR